MELKEKGLNGRSRSNAEGLVVTRGRIGKHGGGGHGKNRSPFNSVTSPNKHTLTSPSVTSLLREALLASSNSVLVFSLVFLGHDLAPHSMKYLAPGM